MSCTQKQQLVSFPKVRIWKPWFRNFNNHKEFRNEGTVHLFSLMALFSYANFRSNERMISGARYMEAPGQWICKLGSLPRILRVHSKEQALEQLEYFQTHGFLTYECVDKKNEIIRFTIANWKEHCTSLPYNYYSYKGSGFFFIPLPIGRKLLKVARKTTGIVFSELDAIMDMWLHTILNDPKVKGSEYMPVVYYSNMHGMPLLSLSCIVCNLIHKNVLQIKTRRHKAGINIMEIHILSQNTKIFCPPDQEHKVIATPIAERIKHRVESFSLL